MEKCPNTLHVTVFGKNQHEKKALLFNPACKQWSCDYCAENLKEGWEYQATRGAQIILSEGRELQFVTLTSRAYATPTQSLYFLQENWPKMSRRMKYITDKWRAARGIHWDYFAVPERHKSGIAHLHIIAATHIASKNIWKQHAHQSGFGFILDVQTLDSAVGVAAYVAKYLHKGQGAENWPKGFRRVRHSRGWPISHEKADENWQWSSYKSDYTAWIEKMALIDMGWQVTDNREL